MHAPTRQRQGRFEPLVWFALAFAVYAAAGSSVFYKTDGPDLLWLLDEQRPHPWHVGYLPLLSAWRALLHAIGIEPSLMRLGTSFSALGAAVGVAAFAAGLRRLDLSAAQRDTATLLLAVCPTTLLFARVVEFHAPLLGGVGLLFWWTIVQLQRPTWWGMVLLGAGTHGAFLLHFSGITLPAWLLSFFVARRWAAASERRRTFALAALAGVVHVLLWLVLPRVFPGFYGVHADIAAAFAKEASIGRPQSLDWTPTIFAQEWLWPVLPLSVTCFAALLRRELWRECAAFAIGFAPFLYLCVRQLVFEPENGAYLLPMVPAAALLTVQAIPVRHLLRTLAAIAVGWFFAVAWTPALLQSGWDDAADYAALTARLDAGSGGKPFVVMLGTHREMAIGYARLQPWKGQAPQRDFLYVRQTATMPRAQYQASVRDGTIAYLRAVIAQGAVVLMTEPTRAFLRDPESVMRAEKKLAEIPRNDEMSGPLLIADLEQAFTFAPAGAPDDRAAVFALQPK